MFDCFVFFNDDFFEDSPGTYRCSIGAKSDEHFCGMYTDPNIQDNPSCYESTENCDEVVLVFYMSCMPADVALNAALSFSLYACLFVSFIYFLVRIVQKKLSVWELETSCDWFWRHGIWGDVRKRRDVAAIKLSVTVTASDAPISLVEHTFGSHVSVCFIPQVLSDVNLIIIHGL